MSGTSIHNVLFLFNVNFRLTSGPLKEKRSKLAWRAVIRLIAMKRYVYSCTNVFFFFYAMAASVSRQDEANPVIGCPSGQDGPTVVS